VSSRRHMMQKYGRWYADWEWCSLFPRRVREIPMAIKKSVFTPEVFRFFRELGRNNKKVWMDANRERYRTVVVEPFRKLLDELAPFVLELDARFDTTGRTGANFSRINRDIR